MQLTAQTRTILGKKIKSLRAQGFVPAELYGHDVSNLHLVVSAKEFAKVFRDAGESTVITLSVQDHKEPFNVLVHDLQIDAMSNRIQHIDFYSVRMDEVIALAVPLEFISEAPAVKEKQGVLIKAMHEIKVEALPADLPHMLTVDLSGLVNLGQSIHVRDLILPTNVKVLVDVDTVIATVTEQAAAEEVVTPLTVQDVKVEGEEKKAKEAAQKESAEKA